MVSGIIIGAIVIIVIGILIIGFSYWAGVETGSRPYKDLGCRELFGYYTNPPEVAKKCNVANAGMVIGLWSFAVGLVFIIVGVMLSIIFGIKSAVDKRKKNVST